MLFSHEIWSWRLRLYTIFSFSLQIYARLGRTVSSSDEVLQVVACIGLISISQIFKPNRVFPTQLSTNAHSYPPPKVHLQARPSIVATIEASYGV